MDYHRNYSLRGPHSSFLESISRRCLQLLSRLSRTNQRYLPAIPLPHVYRNADNHVLIRSSSCSGFHHDTQLCGRLSLIPFIYYLVVKLLVSTIHYFFIKKFIFEKAKKKYAYSLIYRVVRTESQKKPLLASIIVQSMPGPPIKRSLLSRSSEQPLLRSQRMRSTTH